MISNVLAAFIGIAAGFAVGGGFVAFISVLGVLPRVILLSSQKSRLRVIEWALITGALFGTSVMFVPITLNAAILTPVAGLFSGIFIGMMAAALTEVLNVIPLITRRLKISGSLELIITAIIAGKVAGSLFYWLIFLPVWKG
ncbi:stage V sporulation protein AB [Jeotgalibacillus salarius]|uniref:Stage V sporulation protein AB n=1 Tax=Jeotgalibacillus salarius TaxID=546023 RepID=A0A4Y8LKP0_9BACL|nr:stage V sporulation protein AB [Jeotgalibacillus salarius]TFE03132.1 stage V sporulation protein AB [Jeotgalibacillus salarius]